MIKANKKPILKISPQNFCKTCSAWNEKPWTSTGGSYLKNRILQHFNQLRFKAKQIHLTWQYFCETHLGETYENPYNNRSNKMIRFFFRLVVSYQREKNVFCVVFFTYGVIFHNMKRRVWFKIVWCSLEGTPPCLQACVVSNFLRLDFQIHFKTFAA